MTTRQTVATVCGLALYLAALVAAADWGPEPGSAALACEAAGNVVGTDGGCLQ